MTLGPIFTAANLLTFLRMLLIPFFVILLVYGYRGWALLTFLTAGVTDLFDGLIARVTGANTRADGLRAPALAFKADCDRPPATG